MPNRIDRDVQRFNEMLKNLKKKGLEKYFSGKDMGGVTPDGKVLRVPIKQINLPKFRYGSNEGGVGQGDGEVGSPVPGQKGKQGDAAHGDEEGDHAYAELDKMEAAEVLGKKLGLPNLIEKFGGEISQKSTNKYTGIANTGPESLRHLKRTFKQSLLRAIASGEYDPKNPLIIPVRDDKRYRAAKQNTLPSTKVALIYLLDCSGSMEKSIAFLKNVGWWADAWIQKHYSAVERRYIQYDTRAREVEGKKFFTIDASGGTNIAEGLSFTAKVAKEYAQEFYNLYLVHFTDGDCDGIDSGESNSLTEYLIPRASAIFTCEASSGPLISFGPKQQRYSEYLDDLCKADENLEGKLKFINFSQEEIIGEPMKCLLETLEYWFKA